MPEFRSMTVDPSDIRVGDVIDFQGGHKVVSVSRKTKYTYVTIEGRERPMRMEAGVELYGIKRLEKTDEEKAAELLDARLRMLDRSEQGVKAMLFEQQEKIAKALLAGRTLTYSDTESLLKAQAEAAIWARIEHVHRVHAQRTDEDVAEMNARWDDNNNRGSMTRLEAVAYIEEKTKEWILDQTAYLSRSTNVVSNLHDDIERQVAAEFLKGRRYRWF